MIDALLGLPRPRPVQFPGPQLATVSRIDGPDLYVELRSQTGVEMGPCHWSRQAAHSHSNPEGGNTGTLTVATPPTGTGCLVLFASDTALDPFPWVVAFDAWPA